MRKIGRNYIYETHYHLIWCTKFRNNVFTNISLVDEMKELLYNIAAENDIFIEEIEIMPDHVHLLVSFRPKYSISYVVKIFKGRGSYLFLKNHLEIKKKMFWKATLWSHILCWYIR